MKFNPLDVAAFQSPYTVQNVDAAFAHLERVLSSGAASSLFGQTYWRARVVQVSATPGLMHTQRERLHRLQALLERCADALPYR